MKHIGMFGGTFDPPHLAHLIAGEMAVEEFRLDKLLFIPANVPPNKIGQPITSGAHRFAMTQHATEGNDKFEVSEVELNRPGPSYTIDSLGELKGIYKVDVLFLFIGLDQFAAFESWREYKTILTEHRVIVMKRPSEGMPPIPYPLRDHVQFLSIPQLAISSSDIRSRIRAGKSIRYFVPASVREYIMEHGLYSE